MKTELNLNEEAALQRAVRAEFDRNLQDPATMLDIISGAIIMGFSDDFTNELERDFESDFPGYKRTN